VAPTANGRALSATASGGTGTLAQSYTQAYSFSDPAWAAGATVGNLERVTDGGSVVNYDYAQDRLVSTSNAAGATVTTNLHDHAGRLTSKRTGGVETEGFAYDLQDQLRQVRRGGVVTEKLEYDPTGAPLYRMVGNQAVYYVGPFATVTATANAGCAGYACAQGVTGVQVSAHVLLGGSRIASVRATDVLYYHRDQRGSVVATTVTGGGVGAKYRYGPYGQLDKVEVVNPPNGTDAANGSELGFTGGLRLGWNPSTGVQTGSLLLLGARVYDAAMKRWLQADTVDEKRYTYADGDPVNMVDPSGRLPFEPYRPPEGSVCFGSTCVSGDMAGFYAERMLGICSSPAECQLMLGFERFRAGLRNEIGALIKEGRLRAGSGGGEPSAAAPSPGCRMGPSGPECTLPEGVVQLPPPFFGQFTAKQTAEVFAGRSWLEEFRRNYTWNRRQFERFADSETAFVTGMKWLGLGGQTANAIGEVGMLRTVLAVVVLLPDMMRDDPGALIMGRALVGGAVRAAVYTSAVAEVGWAAGTRIGAAADAAVDASFAVTYRAVYGGLSVSGANVP